MVKVHADNISARMRRLFAVHGWLGLNFGLWLFMVCVSGAIATLAPEVEWLTQPALRITPHGPIRWQATYEAIRATHPEHQIYGLTRSEETVLESLAWTVYATAPDKRYGVIRVDLQQTRASCTHSLGHDPRNDLCE